MIIKHEGGRIYDVITGDRVELGENILDTGVLTRSHNPLRAMQSQRTLFLKESTIVWLAEKAGYTLTKRDAGDSSDAESVDGEDASLGGGEAPTGKAKAGGSEAPKRRTRRKSAS